MFLVVGLGNPEEDYSNTRHNMGFNVINKLAEKYEIDVIRKKHKSLMGKGEIEGKKVILLKPQTYMNLSGEAIKDCYDFYKIEEDKLIVIYDDIDINPGTIRLRKVGGPGTHNGMKSVIHELNTQKFARVRVGIGMPEDGTDLIEYVIGAMDENDIPILKEGINKATDAVIEIIKNGIDKAMNKYN